MSLEPGRRSPASGRATRARRSRDHAAPAPTLRRATAALRAALEVDHEWSEQEIPEVATAVAEHLLAVAAVLPSEVPGWLIVWQRLARRHGLFMRPSVEEHASGMDALIDLKVRLDRLAARAEECADRHDRPG